MVNGIARSLPVRCETDQPRLDQYLQMLRNRGLREIEMIHHFAATAGIADGEALQDFNARGMGQRGELCRNGLTVGDMPRPA